MKPKKNPKTRIIIAGGVARNDQLMYMLQEIETRLLHPDHFLEKTVGKNLLNGYLARLSEIHVQLSRRLGPQAYSIEAKPLNGGLVLTITGGDHSGLLYGLRDLMHHHMKEIVENPSARKVYKSSPAVANRWLWSWGVGIHNFERYLDMTSEWKYNGLIMWNSRVPKHMKQIVKYAHARGVKIILGFSWGYPDFTRKHFVKKYPKNAKTYVNILNNKWTLMCTTDPANRQWIQDFVAQNYRKEYRGLGIDGVYFQTFTESNRCPCPDCSEFNTAELMTNWCLPIRARLRTLDPKLFISWGIHTWWDNHAFKAWSGLDVSGGIKPSEYPSFKVVPLEDQLLWEGCEYPEKNVENTKKLLSARGPGENVGLLHRIYGHYGLLLNGNNSPKVHKFMLKHWKKMEKGWVPEHGNGDWRSLKKINDFIEWVKLIQGSKAKQKTVGHLLEGNDWGYYHRLVPLITAEIEWNPRRTRKEFARLFNGLKTFSDLSRSSPVYQKYKALTKI